MKSLEFRENDEIVERIDCKIITTEKDFLRLNNNYLNQIHVIKSELKIIDEEKLIKIIT